MKSQRRSSMTLIVGAGLTLSLLSASVLAQRGPGGFGIDARAERRTYLFEDTNEELPYCLYVSSKVDRSKPAPLIISLHGMGATPDIMCNSTAVNLAEEGGYILAAPMGYNTTGWFGSPVINMGAGRGAPGAGRGGAGAGRGGAGAQVSFDAINRAPEGGSADDHLTPDEIRAFFNNAAGGRGGAPAAAGGGDVAADAITRWDANADGKVTRQEFDSRPQVAAAGGQGRGAAGAAPRAGGQGPGAAPRAGGQGPGAAGRGGGAPAPENLAELSEKDVMNVLAMMRAEFNVDADRIYLTGHSMGGAGTYFLASKHADLWAAVAPVAAASFMMTANHPELLQKLADADLPIMVVHGDQDEVVAVSNSQTWVATMKQIGMEHEYVELPGVTHGPVITDSQKYIYEFFGKHTKKD